LQGKEDFELQIEGEGGDQNVCVLVDIGLVFPELGEKDVGAREEKFVGRRGCRLQTHLQLAYHIAIADVCQVQLGDW
jgi:hypothetical protein